MSPTHATPEATYTLPKRVSMALAIVAGAVSTLSFVFWEVFHRDTPMGVGNMRGTALTLLVLGVPLLLLSASLAARGSLRALFVWLGCLGYFAYNAVMFCFAAHFNSFFLLFTALLALSFWSLVTLLRAIDLAAISPAAARVPTRSTAIYLLFSAAFAALWLEAVVPATLENEMPTVLTELELTQNTVWVLDFAFTFPLMVLGGIWLWKQRPWGYVVGGMMVTMLTLETAGIAVDQVFGHLHDPSAPLSAVPILASFTAAGVFFSLLFLRGVRKPEKRRSDLAGIAPLHATDATLAGSGARPPRPGR
jgi:hypothetical protein